MELHRSTRHIVLAAALAGVVAPAARAENRDRDVASRSGTTVTIVEPSSFDWSDAGVGAAGAVGLMLVASGVVVVVRENASPQRDADVKPSARK